MDEVFITAIVFAFGFLTIKLLFDYLKEKNRVKSRPAESSMTSSELRTLIQDAVEESLDDRLARIEERLDRFEKPRLLPAEAEGELEHPASPPIGRDRDATR